MYAIGLNVQIADREMHPCFFRPLLGAEQTNGHTNRPGAPPLFKTDGGFDTRAGRRTTREVLGHASALDVLGSGQVR